jgi:hypothetical protein
MDKLKPFLPLLYIALGAALGAMALKSCTPEPKVETVVETRTDTIPGPADTVFVTVRVPVRVPYALPPDSSSLEAWQRYAEQLLVDNDRLRMRIDSLENIEAVAITETPQALLTAHLNMPLFLANPKRGLWAEAIITARDTTRTRLVHEPRRFSDFIGYGIHAGAGYNVISRTVDFQIGAGLQLKLDQLFN